MLRRIQGTGRRVGRVTPKPTAPLGDGYTKRVWHKDKEALELDRTLPAGAVTNADLAKIVPGLFLAWNRLQQRWEVWCRRVAGLPPYYVMRVITHPDNVYDAAGRLIYSCPGRPPRSRHSRSCPPTCRGKYEIPDRRLLRVLHSGRLDNVREKIRKIEEEEAAKEAAIMAAAENKISDMLTYNANQLAGVKQVGYGGK